jgi:quercetin dioxygenase-like cupin family protein
MNKDYTFFQNLLKEMPEMLTDSIISRTIYSDDQIKVVLFGFAVGQELSEHTASMPALLYFVSGEAGLSLGEDQMTAEAGSWVRMPANLSHSIHAKTQTTMLLILLRST